MPVVNMQHNQVFSKQTQSISTQRLTKVATKVIMGIPTHSVCLHKINILMLYSLKSITGSIRNEYKTLWTSLTWTSFTLKPICDVLIFINLVKTKFISFAFIPALFFVLKMFAVYNKVHFKLDLFMEANNMNPNQTVLLVAV